MAAPRRRPAEPPKPHPQTSLLPRAQHGRIPYGIRYGRNGEPLVPALSTRSQFRNPPLRKTHQEGACESTLSMKILR